MPAKLTIENPEAPTREIEIGNTAGVGRTRENHVCLSFSREVSRQHAVLRCHNGFQYQITDLGSRNGTFLNGRRVVLPANLANNDTIRIGNVTMRFTQYHLEDDEFAGHTLTAAHLTGHELIQRVAIMVSDIRGFTRESEQLEPPQVAQTLGAWFREAGDAIHFSGGIIDKFIGDAVLAYWTASPPESALCEQVLGCAHQLLDIASHQRWPVTNASFRVGVALHFGSVTSGNIGTNAERDATIIGDTVNTAFRIESLTKELGRTLLVSDAFVNVLGRPGDFTDLGDFQLRGKNQKVRVLSPAGELHVV
jgi:adenylate cyclase